MKIYSNLSLQVIRENNYTYFYDEFFNFKIDTIGSDTRIVIFLLECVKPLPEKTFLYDFISNSIKSKIKVLLVSDFVIDFNFEELSTLDINNLFRLEDISYKMLSLFQFPFRDFGIYKLKTLFRSIFLGFERPSLKVICLDLDKTLWPGVIGESSDNYSEFFHDNYMLYFKFQNLFLRLKNNGVLLALVTKNNYDDVLHFFQKLLNMPISLDDFIVIKASWSDKFKSIKEISSELSLGLESFIFLDDSDLECSLTSSELSQVEVLQVPTDLKKLETFMDVLFCHFRIKIKFEGKFVDKTSQYRIEFDRKKFMDSELNIVNNELNINDLKLNTEVNSDFGIKAFNLLKVSLDFNSLDLFRISEMSEKTNQFNMNKNILSVDEIENLFTLGDNFICCSAKDRFGDYGIIGYAHISKSGKLLNYVLSCRALGRGIEVKFFEYLNNLFNLNEVLISPNKKNFPAIQFANNYINLISSIKCVYL
jgi:HAD superfamily phosphatase (TIGR01681 family)